MKPRSVALLAVCFAVRAGVAAAQDPVFSDGFESGDLSAWTSASTDGGDLSVQSGAALAGTEFGLQAIVDDTTGLYVQDETPNDKNHYRARFYFDPSGFDPGEATGARRTRIFIAFEEGPTRRLMAIVLRRQMGQYSVMARVRRSDNSQADTGFFPITAGEHWLEFDWVRASTPDAADGSFQLWIDGNLVSTLTDLPNGASAVDFVRLGALSVKAGASGVLHWDQFASRELTQIGPSLGPGEFCLTMDQCGSASCVDNVCCNSACGGMCAACDVAASVGTCSPIPSGEDPDAECPGVSCSGYYFGWLGDSCRRKADVSAAQARCDGSQSCRTAAQECTAQTAAGAPAVTCNSFCQDPNVGTCTGTVAGTCTNVNPGTQTCGVGECRRTAPQCVNGSPAACVPGSPSTETCNDLDDDCDSFIDDGLPSDVGGNDDTCAIYRTLPSIGSNQLRTETTLTLYPAGDVDYFLINASETDSTCTCGFFDEDYRLTITLAVPPGAGSYQFCTALDSCGSFTYCQTVFAGTSESWQWDLDGACGIDDSYAMFVRISPSGSPGYECLPYTLSYQFQTGCFGAGAQEQIQSVPRPGASK